MVAPLEGRRSAAIFCDHAAVAEAAAELLVRHGLLEFSYIGSRHALAARSWDAERREVFCAMKTLLAMMDGREYEREATFGVRRVEQRMSTTDMHGSVNRMSSETRNRLSTWRSSAPPLSGAPGPCGGEASRW